MLPEDLSHRGTEERWWLPAKPLETLKAGKAASAQDTSSVPEVPGSSGGKATEKRGQPSVDHTWLGDRREDLTLGHLLALWPQTGHLTSPSLCPSMMIMGIITEGITVPALPSSPGWCESHQTTDLHLLCRLSST